MKEDGVEEMEMGEMEMNGIEKECDKKGKGYVSIRKLELLHEAIIKTRTHQKLEISSYSQKGSKRKSPEEDLKRGRKMNKQRTTEVGVKLIKSCQYPTIMVAFSEVNKVSQ